MDRDTTTSWGVFIGSLLALLAFDPYSRPVGLDPATWDYMSISLLDGRLPYRDIFLHKTPLAAFIGGLGAAISVLFGGSPLDGAHTIFLILGAAAPALLCLLICQRAPRLAAVAAAVWMLAFDQWLIASIEGVRPKVATTAFGLACLVAAERKRPALAGLFGGLATLCWQPGIAFLGAALWPLFRDAGAARVRFLFRVAIGAATPALVLLTFMASIGALDDFFAQAVGFNLHYINLHSRSPWNTVTHLYELLLQWNSVELLLLPASLAALSTTRGLIPHSLSLAGLLYLGLMFVNFQAWPDMILLAPMVAAIIGCGLFAAITALGAGEAVSTVAVLAAALSAAVPASGRATPPITFEDQAVFIAGIAGDLGPDDTVLTVSYPELLIHTGRHSVWTWPYMWFGVDQFAGATADNGFESILAQLDQHPPQVMVVARRWAGPLRRSFERWAAPRYTRTQMRQYPHTVRPIAVYRRKE
jgi:hypothetical protein